MTLTSEEKSIIQEALQIYLQIIARQLPQQKLKQVYTIVEGISKKIENIGKYDRKGSKPPGISDEWFKNVCKTCKKFSGNGCSDKVTEKFPGKCDPILIYERNKSSATH